MLTVNSCLKMVENCCILGVKAKAVINESRQFTATMIGAMPEGTDAFSLLNCHLCF